MFDVDERVYFLRFRRFVRVGPTSRREAIDGPIYVGELPRQEIRGPQSR